VQEGDPRYGRGGCAGCDAISDAGGSGRGHWPGFRKLFSARCVQWVEQGFHYCFWPGSDGLASSSVPTQAHGVEDPRWSSERETVSLTDKFNAIGCWIQSLTFSSSWLSYHSLSSH